LIRIFDTDSGKILQELRRGSDQAEIYCLSFDPIYKFLASSSDKGTIHIFAIKSDVVLAASQNAKSHDIDKEDIP
jgi:WD40 repeat protein